MRRIFLVLAILVLSVWAGHEVAATPAHLAEKATIRLAPSEEPMNLAMALAGFAGIAFVIIKRRTKHDGS